MGKVRFTRYPPNFKFQYLELRAKWYFSEPLHLVKNPKRQSICLSNEVKMKLNGHSYLHRNYAPTSDKINKVLIVCHFNFMLGAYDRGPWLVVLVTLF